MTKFTKKSIKIPKNTPPKDHDFRENLKKSEKSVQKHEKSEKSPPQSRAKNDKTDKRDTKGQNEGIFGGVFSLFF